ncbi:MAG: CHAT domain-containing protein [Acidobacteria bacterium]|nr:CHAT domain-containing protein [Acidobacteriota bacterium]MBI3424506.1 CHAT domain-containing protein [Acidobacteriota bacterium]
MKLGRSGDKRAIRQRSNGLLFFILLVGALGWLFKSESSVRWFEQTTRRGVAYAETLATHTQTFRLIPDNTAALAAKHFQQAQAALATAALAPAQAELEKALSFAELALTRTTTLAQADEDLQLVRQYYQVYLGVLLQRHQLQPEEGFATRAWEAHDRLRWLLSQQAKNSSRAVSRMLTVAEVQQQLLDEQSLLLEYALGEEQSYLWAITKIGFACFTLPGRAVLEPKAARLHELLSTQPDQAIDDPNAEFDTLARELSGWLLKPVAAQMRLRQLLIVTDGILQQVPFSALPVPESTVAKNRPARLTETSLLAQHEVVNLPAAATGVWLRQRHPQPASPPQTAEPFAGSVAVIADPVFGKYDERVRVQRAPAVETPTPATFQLGGLDGMLTRLRYLDLRQVFASESEVQQMLLARLPAARTEAEAILKLAPHSEKWLDFEASRSLALSGKLAAYPVLHFATHGVLDPADPAASGLLLSQVNERGEAVNGLLLSREISQLNLSAELVVLSACESGLDELASDRPSHSVAQSFMQAGAHRVVASLWKVNDAATAELMQRFYAKLFGAAALRPAQALRAAQLELARAGRWRRPFYWAGFVLAGEG